VRTLPADYDRPETIEETAELVTNLGGKGIAIAVDHLVPDQVKALAERLKKDFCQIHILVNDIWGAELLKGGPAEWNTPVWELDLAKGLRILRLAIDTHIITSKFLLPLLISEPGGLLIEVTDGTTKYNASHYRISVYYDLAKVAVNRLAFSQGHELAPYGATAVAITPGWLRSEMMLENYGVTEANWRDAIDHPQATVETAPYGINNRGQIVGGYDTAGFAVHGFVLDRGRYTAIDVPGAVVADRDHVSVRGHDRLGGRHLFRGQYPPRQRDQRHNSWSWCFEYNSRGKSRGSWSGPNDTALDT